MASIFSRIVNGEIPCYKVAESEDFLAFLDIQPLALGHTLVIPKKEVDYIFDLDDATYLGYSLLLKRWLPKWKLKLIVNELVLLWLV